MATILARRSVATAVTRRLERGSIRQPFLDAKFALGQTCGNPPTGQPIAIQGVALRPAAGQMSSYGVGDGVSVVIDVDHIGAPLAALLTASDIHRGHPEVGALAEGDAGIPDDAFGM